MPTSVMMHRLYPQIGDTTTMLPLGSIWEAMLGMRIRSYQKAMSDEQIRKNYHA